MICVATKGRRPCQSFRESIAIREFKKNEGQKISDKGHRTNKPKNQTQPPIREAFVSPAHNINNVETERNNNTDSTYRCVRAALARIPLDRLRIVDLILGCDGIKNKNTNRYIRRLVYQQRETMVMFCEVESR